MFPIFSSHNKESIIFFVLSIIWLAYLLLRAIYVPFVYDESATFFHFIHRGEFMPYNSLPDANNHFINSILTFVSYNIFGNSKLALRLPNLLSAVLFLWYLFALSGFIKNRIIRWVFILSIMFSHFFIEFFALSRGYGLSMAFLVGAFYHLLRYTEKVSTKDLLWISLFLLLAELSNLSILVLVIAIIGYQITVLLVRNIRRQTYKHFVLLFFTQIIPLIFASSYMFYLSQKGSLYYGDSSGFWNLTVQTLILLLIGHKSIFLSITVIGFTIILIAAIITSLLKSGIKIIFEIKLVFPILLFITVIGVILVSKLFNIHDPEDRVAMYFIPLFLGSIPMVTDYFLELTKRKIVFIPLIFLLLLPVHFVYSMNMTYVNGYIHEVIPMSYYNTIANDKDFDGKAPATIGGYRMRMFSWIYMNYMAGGEQNLIDYQSYPETQSDYQIVDIDEYPEWLDYYDVIETEKIIGRKLLKRKEKLEFILVDQKTVAKEVVSNNEYYRLAQWKSESLKADSYYLTIEMDIHSQSSPFHAWVVLQFSDISGKTIMYKNIPFDWLKTDWSKDGSEFNHSLLTGKLPNELDQIKLYIWNLDKVEYSINDLKVDLFEVR